MQNRDRISLAFIGVGLMITIFGTNSPVGWVSKAVAIIGFIFVMFGVLGLFAVVGEEQE